MAFNSMTLTVGRRQVEEKGTRKSSIKISEQECMMRIWCGRDPVYSCMEEHDRRSNLMSLEEAFS